MKTRTPIAAMLALMLSAASPALPSDAAVITAKKALDAAMSLVNLAEAYMPQSKSAQAEPLYKRSPAIVEKNRGPKHPDVAERLENLAALYRASGKARKAVELEKRAAAIRAAR